MFQFTCSTYYIYRLTLLILSHTKCSNKVDTSLYQVMIVSVIPYLFAI